MPAAALVGPGLVCRRILVLPADVVYIKGIFEASDGVVALFAQHGGDLLLAAPVSKLEELDELLRDLRTEIHNWTEVPSADLWTSGAQLADTSSAQATDTVARCNKSF
jgi:hypothetical protein